MDFPVKTSSPAGTRTGCAIVPMFEDRALGAAAKEFDRAGNGLISRLRRAGDIRGKAGETLLVPNLGSGIAAQRLLLVGSGKSKEYAAKQYGAALKIAAKILANTGIREAVSFLAWDGVKAMTPYYQARRAVERIDAETYRFQDQKTNTANRPRLNKVGLGLRDKKQLRVVREGVRHGLGIAAGVATARNLGNRSANLCTPSHLVQEARQIAKGHKKMSVTVLGEQEIRQHKMGAFLSVTAGTDEPAKFIVMKYVGSSAKQPPVVLIGKGITFDSGGISLKPPPAMDEMKFDMGGAAGVLGTMATVAMLSPNLNIVALIPSCENMPSGRATKPGDIVTTMSGQTVEVLNTDAEGRLILCDALTYAKRFKPRCLIDVATLTGACIIALGNHNTGLFSNDDELAELVSSAALRAEDSVWRLPCGEEYGQSLKSNFADFANVGSREGGASIAAHFLSRFVDDTPWVHLDVAGTAWQSGTNKGGTGRPVPLLTDYLLTLPS